MGIGAGWCVGWRVSIGGRGVRAGRRSGAMARSVAQGNGAGLLSIPRPFPRQGQGQGLPRGVRGPWHDGGLGRVCAGDGRDEGDAGLASEASREMYASFGAYLGESADATQQRIDAWDAVERKRRRASVKRDAKQLSKLIKGARGGDVEALFLESGYFMTLKHKEACLVALAGAAGDAQASGERWPLDGLADQATIALLCREATRGLADESLPLSRLAELAEAAAKLRKAGFARMLPTPPWADSATGLADVEEEEEEEEEVIDDGDDESVEGLFLPDDADAVTLLLETVGGAIASEISWASEKGDGEDAGASPAMHRKVARSLEAFASARHSHAGLVQACTAFYLRNLNTEAPLAKGIDTSSLSVACRSLASIGFSVSPADLLDTHARDVRSAILLLAGRSERTQIRDAWALSIALATCTLGRGDASADDLRGALGSALTTLLVQIDADVMRQSTQTRGLSVYALCELHQAIVACELLGEGNSPVSEQVRKACSKAFTAAGTNTRRMSALQEDARTVLADLQRPAMGSEVLDPITGYVIDLTCGNATTPASGRRALAIEVNGPSHYALSTGEPLGHTLLKEALLRSAFHPQGTAVVSLDYAEWGVLVGPKDRRDFLEDIIADAESLCLAHASTSS